MIHAVETRGHRGDDDGDSEREFDYYKQGFLTNGLKYAFDYGYGKFYYIFKMPLTYVPYTLAYMPAMSADYVFNWFAPKWAENLDCKWFGMDCRQNWVILILRNQLKS